MDPKAVARAARDRMKKPESESEQGEETFCYACGGMTPSYADADGYKFPSQGEVGEDFLSVGQEAMDSDDAEDEDKPNRLEDIMKGMRKKKSYRRE